ncbi:MAG: hypothetical protein ABIW47_02060 [Ginsengibacter sp.]
MWVFCFKRTKGLISASWRTDPLVSGLPSQQNNRNPQECGFSVLGNFGEGMGAYPPAGGRIRWLADSLRNTITGTHSNVGFLF